MSALFVSLKVAQFEVPRSRTARHVNVKHLKLSIYKILKDDNRRQKSRLDAEASIRAPTPDAAATTEHSFCDVYRRLPKMLSPENAANLSFAMAFACTL